MNHTPHQPFYADFGIVRSCAPKFGKQRSHHPNQTLTSIELESAPKVSNSVGLYRNNNLSLVRQEVLRRIQSFG